MKNIWEQAWLSYPELSDKTEQELFSSVGTNAGERIEEDKNMTGHANDMVGHAMEEICLAAEKLYGITCEKKDGTEEASLRLILEENDNLGEEGFTVTEAGKILTIRAWKPAGLLYGAFYVILCAARGERLTGIEKKEVPCKKLRMLNHWDNPDGSIERGYSGNSFFFEEGKLIINDRTKDYFRLLASAGINAIVINNVNVKAECISLIAEPFYAKLKELTELAAGYAVKVYICADFAAPIVLGGLETADPLEPVVREWWKKTVAALYEHVPLLGGFLVKADSEGRPGPFAYGRNHADGANMLGEALEPVGGIVIWRCFVYNCEQDWRDQTVDRARAAYDNFMPMDGAFRDNVLLQIKNGPIDFQVREPVHPLFGSLKSTRQLLELQIAQEYTGQQRHVFFLVPMWKEIMDFHTCAGKDFDTVKECVEGMAGVSNTGDDPNWTGHDLAGANLYGYGRLCWNPSLSAEQIAEEWIRLALTRETEAVGAVKEILMTSPVAYEEYTAPLGVGFMVTPHDHYGPSVDGYEYDRWGTYHRANHEKIGIDRTTATGTGYAGLYFGENKEKYEDVSLCPDELLLFFHRVPYSHVLHSGETVLQHIYNTHFHGVELVDHLYELWLSVENKVPEEIFKRTKERLEHQKMHSREWRDQINTYFWRMTMIPDEGGRKIYE